MPLSNIIVRAFKLAVRIRGIRWPAVTDEQRGQRREVRRAEAMVEADTPRTRQAPRGDARQVGNGSHRRLLSFGGDGPAAYA